MKIKSEWQSKKLKDMTTKIGSGATPRGGQSSYKSNGIPLIRSLNVYDLYFNRNNLAFIDDDQADKLANVEVQEGDVLLNITGASVCRCTSVPNNLVPARVNQHVSIIRSDGKNLDGEYLKYVLVSSFYKKQLMGLARTGATREALTKTDIENFEIKLPPVECQSHIAAILSAYDDLIGVNEKRIKILEEMGQRLYIEWFVKLKFLGYEKTRLLDSGTEYGQIPKGWKVKSLGDLVNIVSGFPFKSIGYLESGKYKIVTIKNVHDGKFILNFDSFLDELPQKLPKSCVLERGDILLSLTGNVGRVCVVYGERHFLNQRVAKLDPIGTNKREYIYFMFRQSKFQKQLEAMSNGVAQQNLSPIQLKNFSVVVPSEEIVDKFSEIVRSCFDEIVSLNERNSVLLQARDLLIPQLVTGKRELK